MCGIGGIAAWGPRWRPTRDVLQRLSAAIAHRGPDAAGVWLQDDPPAGRPQVGLVHRRLAVIDLDRRANQPMTDAAGRVIVYNGEIYNFRELRTELAQAGATFRTDSDTEVLLAAYARWRERCLERLNGMYAFALWDAPAGRLVLARDRMGQKPLYWSAADDTLAFASEPAALLTLPWVDRALDRAALAEYLAWGFVRDGSVYRGIRKLPPGCWMSVEAATPRIERYFDPNTAADEARPGDEPLAVRRTRSLVLRAVERQLVSDVPLGCFLSGGVDSSIVAAAMCRAAGRAGDVLTFTVGFDDPRYDETGRARTVARHLGTKHEEFIVRPDAAADLPALAAAFGEPLGDSSCLPTHYLAREVRRRVKVALSGDGGDELFGGYDRYRAMALGERLPGPLRAVARLAGRALPWRGAHPKSPLHRLGRFAASLDEPPGRRYCGYLAIFDAAQIGRLLADPAAGAAPLEALAAQYEQLRRARCAQDPVRAALALDRAAYLPEDLLAKVDRCSMLHALEVRSPFMDHELVAFAAGLPVPLLIRGGGKRLLRRAFAADLPPDVFAGPKRGFAVPVGDWFRGQLRPLLRDALLGRDSFAAAWFDRSAVEQLIDQHHQRIADHSQRLYALLMLELWHRAHGRSGRG